MMTTKPKKTTIGSGMMLASTVDNSLIYSVKLECIHCLRPVYYATDYEQWYHESTLTRKCEGLPNTSAYPMVVVTKHVKGERPDA